MKNEENNEDLDVKKERDKLDKMGAKSTWGLLEGQKKKNTESSDKEKKHKPFT
ncbi:MAG: hypothetical protein ACOC4M_06830 [Promethearchaeia archaeon]